MSRVGGCLVWVAKTLPRYNLKRYSINNFQRLYIRGSREEGIGKLSKALVICWNKIAPTLFKSLINSIEERYNAVIKAKGWHTRF